jgi:hypothetical protein
LYASPNIIRVIKSRKEDGRAGHIARMGQIINAYSILVGKSEGRDHLEELSIVEMIILEWILRKENGNL